ncbi:MAG TPA: hypothetical protein VHD61_15570 [Lacunisphaera sp.]|nr:hypothetical protein [Lacunisphaera sp.]
MSWLFWAKGDFTCQVWYGPNSKEAVGPMTRYPSLAKAQARVRKEIEKHGDKVRAWAIFDESKNPPERVAGSIEDAELAEENWEAFES